ncbi:nuclear transport factor 2 family protein [Mycobacterium deserti]|uniref:Nuclear transport factor 2 family protein n=1 Tax=Mycobacterium deserti TaxID=2978347 RepID=A0ABT2MFP0_9MYCO|nr:nuclear transport factor 2 family protein [Mycobacterium deserti]MCT7661099.1 nuclear transport factor 2 family protein [Mycobacterium deserti]
MADTVLQEMIDEFELRRLVHTYCRAVDRGDIEVLRDLYYPDAVDAHGGFSAGAVDQFLQQISAARPYIRSMQHHITTVNFTITGTTAEGEIYTIAVHTLAGGGRDVDVVVGGRYLDKYEKRDGTWKIVERTIVTDWARVDDPSTMDLSHPITKDTLKGAPDATDPSFDFLSSWAVNREQR